MKNPGSTFGIVFYLKKYKAINGKAPIYIRITVDGKRVDISTKQTIEITNWNEDKGTTKGSREEIKLINNYLEQIRAQVVAGYQELLFQNKLITAEAIKNKFLGKDQLEYALSSLIDYHNDCCKSNCCGARRG